MITERKEFGMISVLADGQIQVREDTIIERDGVEISKIYFREVIDVTTDISNKAEIIKKITAIVWTPEIVAARKAAIQKELDRMAQLPPPNPSIMPA